MRWIVIAAVVLAAGSASTRAALAAVAPPVIHEPFVGSFPPCPAHPVSTLDLEGCSERRLLRSDKAINARARTIFRLLSTNAARTAFVAGEQSWLRYRTSSCAAQASFYAGGTAQPVEFALCEEARNKTHLADLAPLEQVLRQH